VTSVHGDSGARDRIRSALDSTLVVVAGAGTGKTTALVGRIVELVRTGRASLGEIAAITFTEAAAAELRQRIREQIDEVAAQHPNEARLVAARQEVDEAAICTLHAFAQRILVEHGVAAGIPPGFEVLDETAERFDFDTRFERFADALLADKVAEPALVRGFSLGLSRDELADIARSFHRHWDRLEDGGLEILERMRPASGAWPPADPRPVLDAIDAATALARWCTDDSDKLKEHLATLAAVGKQLAACDDEQSTLQFLDGLRALHCSYGQQGNWDEHVDEVRSACAAVEQARQDLLGASRHAVLAELGARLATFVMTVADQRRAEGRLGFHDLLVQARRLLRNDRGAVDAVRRRYRHLLIDEFQDTDPIQVELAARITAAVDGSADLRDARPGGLFVVGDPKQSIYRFRRADIELFSRVGRQIGEEIVLVTNFRSVPGILRFVNTVFAELFGTEPVPGQAAHHELRGDRDPIPLHWRGGSSKAAATAARRGDRAVQLPLDGLGIPAEEATDTGGTPRRPAGGGMPPVVLLGGPMKATMAEVRRAATRDAATTIDDVRTRWAVFDKDVGETRAARWRDIAVLLPARTALGALEEALEDARIPYRLEGVAMLWGSDEVRDVLAVLRGADDPVDRVAVLAALRSPGLACGDDDLVTWRQAGGHWDPRAQVPAGLENHPVAGALAVLARLHDERWWHEPSAMVALAFDELRSFELCLAYHRPRDHWHRLRWLLDQARLFDETVGGSLRSFLAWAELQAEDDRRSGGVGPPDLDDDAVRVMTIHGSKGLEFPVVVLAGLERDVAPGQRPPAVLWNEDGTPELRGGPRLRSHGFEDANERDRALDALEQHRLLYVGMTRARDHLVLCLHHKEAKNGVGRTEAALVNEICLHVPQLWRRLPVLEPAAGDAAAAASTSSTASTPEAASALAALSAKFGVTAPPGPDTPDDARIDEAEVAAWRSRVETFATQRARVLHSSRRAPVTTATAVVDDIATAASSSGDHRAAAGIPWGRKEPDPGSPDSTGALWRDADTSLQIGRAVHGALASIDLSTGTDAAGRSARDVARARAASQGVAAHADAIAAMVDVALASPTVAAGRNRRHWRELYVAVPVDGGVLEGFVDLVLEDDDGLTVVDYKTDRTGGTAGLRRAADRYRPQVASYALALEEATGRPVRRAVLVFVGDGDAGEDVLEGDELVAECVRARQAAGGILAAMER
jgi:ATP-dependent exoDNAse (exonuclease V) beta subunit